MNFFRMEDGTIINLDHLMMVEHHGNVVSFYLSNRIHSHSSIVEGSNEDRNKILRLCNLRFDERE